MSLASSLVHREEEKVLKIHTSSDTLSHVVFHPDSGQLVAIASESSVQVLSTEQGEDGRWSLAEVRATWALGGAISAIAWSPRSTASHFEQVVASISSSSLVLLTQSAETGSQAQSFGVTSGRVHDVQFGRTTGQEQQLASVGDDGLLYLWDLASIAEDGEPTLCLIAHPHPLRSVSYHPSVASQVLTLDARGCLRIFNTHTTPPSLLLTLTEPQSLSARGKRGDSAHGEWNPADGGASLGAVVDGRWAVWDLRKCSGGGPVGFGTAYGDECRGREVFLWNPRNPRQFATLSTSAHASPALKIYSTSYPQAPRRIDLAPPPLQAMDMSWSPAGDVIAVVVGRDLVLVSVE